MREYEEGFPVDANDRYYQANHPDPDRRNSSNFGFAGVKRNAVTGGNKAREDATDYLNERLKVMPYESTEVLFDQRVEIPENEFFIAYEALPISAGNSVKVTWDGVEYACEAIAVSEVETDAVAFGNVYGEGTFPFVATVVPSRQVTVITRSQGGHGEHDVKIEGNVIHTIDPKFGTAFRVNVWYNGSAYVADKTCAEIREAERKKYPIVGTYTNMAGKVYTMIGCDASSADLVRLAAFDVGSIDLVVYTIRIIEGGEVGVNVTRHTGTNTDEV